MDAHAILKNIEELSTQFALERNERQRRRELDSRDFDQLRETGFLHIVVPVEYGGVWEGLAGSTRFICEMLRTLARGDSSVALVASMHPAVIQTAGWLDEPEQPIPASDPWSEQRQWAFQTACNGHFWGTIVSEPGTGGDPSKTKLIARLGPTEGTYLLSGQKHFGSGSGITSYMITNAIPEGETEPTRFFMDMQGVPWDGSSGVKLVAAWDGHGMTATQSHGMQFEDFPLTRIMTPSTPILSSTTGLGRCGFTAVIVGIVEVAVEAAYEQLKRKGDSISAYEQVEWANIEQEVWLIQQAYEGQLRAMESNDDKLYHTLMAKTTVAGLAESALTKICRVLSGSTYSRHTPFGYWLQDVRALGFLRPPWAMAYDQIISQAWETAE